MGRLTIRFSRPGDARAPPLLCWTAGKEQARSSDDRRHEARVSCQRCGTSNAADAASCAGCGEPIAAAAGSSRRPPFDRRLKAAFWAVLISACGAFAISEIHRTAPPLDGDAARADSRRAGAGKAIAASRAEAPTRSALAPVVTPTRIATGAPGAIPDGFLGAAAAPVPASLPPAAPLPVARDSSTVQVPAASESATGAMTPAANWRAQLLPPRGRDRPADPGSVQAERPAPVTLADASESGRARAPVDAPAPIQELAASPATPAPRQMTPPLPVATPPMTASAAQSDRESRLGADDRRREGPRVDLPSAPVAASARTAPAPAAPEGRSLAQAQAAECGSSGTFGRVVCNERVRASFCAGRWNRHPDCPMIENTSNL